MRKQNQISEVAKKATERIELVLQDDMRKGLVIMGTNHTNKISVIIQSAIDAATAEVKKEELGTETPVAWRFVLESTRFVDLGHIDFGNGKKSFRLEEHVAQQIVNEHNSQKSVQGSEVPTQKAPTDSATQLQAESVNMRTCLHHGDRERAEAIGFDDGHSCPVCRMRTILRPNVAVVQDGRVMSIPPDLADERGLSPSVAAASQSTPSDKQRTIANFLISLLDFVCGRDPHEPPPSLWRVEEKLRSYLLTEHGLSSSPVQAPTDTSKEKENASCLAAPSRKQEAGAEEAFSIGKRVAEKLAGKQPRLQRWWWSPELRRELAAAIDAELSPSLAARVEPTKEEKESL